MIISHDLGTTGNKATLVDQTGRLVNAVTVNYGADWGADGRAEQNPADWWNALCEASRTLIEKSGIDANDVVVVSFSGQMMGMVPLDGAGEPIRPSIIWADTRAQQQTQQLIDRIGMEECYRITGHRLNPTYSIEKIMWLRDNEPDNFSQMRHFLLAKDYVAYELTGVMATDKSDASSTNAYDQQARAWSSEIIAAADLDESMFPEIVESTQVIGEITAEAAEATGLAAGTKVVMGGGDGPMAALGAGIIAPEDGAYVYLGSSSWVSVSSPEPLVDPEMRSMTFNHVVPEMFVPTATMQAGGASLAWIVEQFSAEEGTKQFAELLAAAADVEAATEGLFFLPYLLGERSPHWNPKARGAFVGLHIDHKRAAMVRAVVEGVAFNLYTGLRAFTENGVKVEHIDAIGGAANAQLMLSIMADVWQVPISVRDLVDEATAIGAAVVGGVGAGLFDFDTTKKLSSRTERFEPRPARTRALERPYQQFLDAYTRLEPWFDEL